MGETQTIPPNHLDSIREATGRIETSVAELAKRQAENDAAVKSIQERLRGNSLSLPGAEDYRKNWSFTRVAKALHTGDFRNAQFEHDVSEELKRGTVGDVRERVFSTLTGGAGGFLVPAEMMPGIVAALDAQAKARSLGVTVVKPSGYPYSIVKETSTASASAASELGTYAEQTVTFGKIDLQPKKIATRFIVTQEQMMWANPQTDQVIDRKIGVGIANEEDRQILNGGLLPSEMLGILNTTGILTTAGVNAANDALVWGDINRAWSKLMAANADQSGGEFSVYMHSIEFAKLARQLAVHVASQNETDGAGYTSGFPFMSPARFREITGFNVAHSTTVPATLGGGTESYPITGNFRDFYLAEFGGMVLTKSDIATDGTRNAYTEDLVHVKAVVWRDGAVVRPGSFHTTTGIVLGTA